MPQTVIPSAIPPVPPPFVSMQQPSKEGKTTPRERSQKVFDPIREPACQRWIADGASLIENAEQGSTEMPDNGMMNGSPRIESCANTSSGRTAITRLACKEINLSDPVPRTWCRWRDRSFEGCSLIQEQVHWRRSWKTAWMFHASPPFFAGSRHTDAQEEQKRIENLNRQIP